MHYIENSLKCVHKSKEHTFSSCQITPPSLCHMQYRAVCCFGNSSGCSHCPYAVGMLGPVLHIPSLEYHDHCSCHSVHMSRIELDSLFVAHRVVLAIPIVEQQQQTPKTALLNWSQQASFIRAFGWPVPHRKFGWNYRRHVWGHKNHMFSMGLFHMGCVSFVDNFKKHHVLGFRIWKDSWLKSFSSQEWLFSVTFWVNRLRGQLLAQIM